MDYNIMLDSFEGPLDLLLNLISKTKIDIYDIPIHTITEQYMKYIYDMEEMKLDIASDFLVMASTLLEIKSKLLLPKEKIILDGEEVEVDPREELLRRLLEYKKFKEAADKLKEFESQKSKTYYKPQEDLTDYKDDEIDFNSFDLDILIKTLNELLSRQAIFEEDTVPKEIKRDEYKISECIDIILIKLEKLNKINFNDLIHNNSKTNEIVSYFLSLLELIMTRNIMVSQEEAFSDLIIEKMTLEEI